VERGAKRKERKAKSEERRAKSEERRAKSEDRMEFSMKNRVKNAQINNEPRNSRNDTKT